MRTSWNFTYGRGGGGRRIPHLLIFIYKGYIHQPTVCFSVLRIRDVYPGSRILIFTHPGSRISDPGSKNSNKREGWKKLWCHIFLCSHKFRKIVHYFNFEVLQKKIWANFQRIIELFAQKIVTKLSKVWVWDPGSGKNLFRIPDPGVKKAPDPRSRIRIRNTAVAVPVRLNAQGNTIRVHKLAILSVAS